MFCLCPWILLALVIRRVIFNGRVAKSVVFNTIFPLTAAGVILSFTDGIANHSFGLLPAMTGAFSLSYVFIRYQSVGKRFPRLQKHSRSIGLWYLAGGVSLFLLMLMQPGLYYLDYATLATKVFTYAVVIILGLAAFSCAFATSKLGCGIFAELSTPSRNTC